MSELRLSGVCVKLGGKEIVRDISFILQERQILCVLGANGSGKSTLLRAILGLVDCIGEITFNDKILSHLSSLKRSRLLSYVPQMDNIIFPFSLLEVVLMGRYARSSLFAYSTQDKEWAFTQLERLNIAHLADKPFSSLSGGQRQLGLIARALTQDSQIIILDEPVSALDISYSFKLLEIIQSLKTHKTIILTSHHPEQCFIADLVLMMKNGERFYFGNAQDAFVEEHINTLYDIQTTLISLPNGGKYFCQI